MVCILKIGFPANHIYVFLLYHLYVILGIKNNL